MRIRIRSFENVSFLAKISAKITMTEKTKENDYLRMRVGLFEIVECLAFICFLELRMVNPSKKKIHLPLIFIMISTKNRITKKT